MSNTGQAVLGIVGGVIGFYLGGPTGAAYGFQIGLAVGTVVSPTQLPGTYGPRLTDNRTTTSQIGVPVTQVFGTEGVPGVVMWLGNITETATTEEVGGKGGPEGEQTTYSYNQPIAIGLCAGPMVGLTRVWENGKLVYDVRPVMEGESDAAYSNRLAASTDYALQFTLYLGDEDQLPDPTIELKEGVGNVPAFRGLMYIVYHDRRLRDDQARRHPNFKFEVTDGGEAVCFDATDYSNEVLYDWIPTDNPINLLNTNIYNTDNTLSYTDAITEIKNQASTCGNWADAVFIGAANYANTPTVAREVGGDGFGNNRSSRCVLWFSPVPVDGYVPFVDDAGDPISYDYCYVAGTNPGSVKLTSGFGLSQATNVPSSVSGPGTPVGYPICPFDNIGGCEGIPGTYYWQYTPYRGLLVDRYPGPPLNPCALAPPSGRDGFCVIDGYLVSSGDWTAESEPSNYRAMRSYGWDGLIPVSATGCIYPRNPLRPVGHPDDTEEFWTAAYDSAVTAGLMPAGMTFTAANDGDGLTTYPQLQASAYSRQATYCTLSGDRVSIAVIVREICLRCGLAEADIDVSELEDRYVNGYQLARVMDGRSAIAPLRSVGFFDCVESGGILKFPVRGKASVRTLTIDDLGAHAFDNEAPAAVTTQKQQDVELPRQLFVQFRDPERDYETNEQPSPTRLTTAAVNDVYVDVAVSIGATQAKQCAEVLWADAWASRWRHLISLDCSQVELEPTDCFLIPVDGRSERVRAVSVEDSAVILRSFQLVRDDDGAYVSEAIADAPAVLPSVIVIYSSTELLLLDLPPLRVADNDVGIYAAARPSDSGLTWTGAQIFRALDGVSFTAIAAVVNEATTGTVVAPFAAGDTAVFDDVTVITLTLTSGSSLESRPDADVFDGTNSIAIGADGRWEILQFGVAVQTGDATWEISHLLRGRRGTEHVMGMSEAGDIWVLISGAGIIRLPLDNAQLNQAVTYKAVTLGTSYASGIDQSFTSHGVARLPFSPVSITGERETSGDILITWIRRDRLGEELPDGSAIAMSDPPESYEIDILSDDSPPTVARTLTSGIEQVTYTAADQSIDFGSPIPVAITVNIYQISTIVGRGTVGTGTI